MAHKFARRGAISPCAAAPISRIISGMGPLKSTLRELYEGETIRAYHFRYVLLALDIGTIFYLIVSTFFYGHQLIEWIDPIFGLYILADYAARIYIAPNRAVFILSPLNILDLIVMVSFLAPFMGESLAFLRAARVIRLIRSYHMAKRLRQDSAFFRQREDVVLAAVNLMLFLFVVTELVFVTQVRRNDQINNFVDAMYFTITTLTTTGFGDITLKDTTGRLLSIIIMIFGVSLFVRLIQTLLRPYKVRYECKTCGLFLHDADSIHCKHCGSTLAIPDSGLV